MYQIQWNWTDEAMQCAINRLSNPRLYTLEGSSCPDYSLFDPMSRNRPIDPPSYQGISYQPSRNPATFVDGCDENERTTLLPKCCKHDDIMSKCLSIIIIGLISLFIVFVLQHPTSEKVYENMRRDWAAEERRHQTVRDAWNIENMGYNSERKAMVVERETWTKEREDRSLERKVLAAEMEEWQMEKRLERKSLETEKEKWREEQIQDRKSLVAEKEKWREEQIQERKSLVAEKEEWRKEQIDREAQKHREEEEKRSLITWQGLKPSTKCLRYGTREYSATLTNVPLGWDALTECSKKTIDIHGRQVLPSRCDTQGLRGTVVGHWVVDFNEAACVTWWRGYDNKGCVEPGIHRYESVLENLQNGDDWHEMCATTPGYPQGRYFPGPTSCASWRSGINAIWLVEDGSCY